MSKPYTDDELAKAEKARHLLPPAAAYVAGRMLVNIASLRAEVERLTRERDEALALLERWKSWLETHYLPDDYGMEEEDLIVDTDALLNPAKEVDRG